MSKKNTRKQKIERGESSPSGDSFYARKVKARNRYIEKGGSWENWVAGRRAGTIKI